MKSDRVEFNETWLFESPRQIGDFPTYTGLCQIINDLIRADQPVIKVKDTLNKIELLTAVYYWYETDNQILLGSELLVKPQGLVVRLTGKNPNLKRKPPFASDLYKDILNDTDKAIRLMSDEQLSDEGYNLWKRLYDDAICVSVYDNSFEKGGQSYKWLKSFEDFESYFGKGDVSFGKHQYIISKRKSSALAETLAHFNNRRLRELAGLDLD